jgi:hypothetical protein
VDLVAGLEDLVTRFVAAEADSRLVEARAAVAFFAAAGLADALLVVEADVPRVDRDTVDFLTGAARLAATAVLRVVLALRVEGALRVGAALRVEGALRATDVPAEPLVVVLDALRAGPEALAARGVAGCARLAAGFDGPEDFVAVVFRAEATTVFLPTAPFAAEPAFRGVVALLADPLPTEDRFAAGAAVFVVAAFFGGICGRPSASSWL